MPVNTLPKADLLLDEADSDAPVARLWTPRETCDTLRRIRPTSDVRCFQSNILMPLLSPIYFACAAMLMLPQRCEERGEGQTGFLFASKDETLWPSDR
jgi:hypothetical protein